VVSSYPDFVFFDYLFYLMCSSAHGRIGCAVSMLWQANSTKDLGCGNLGQRAPRLQLLPMRVPTELMSTAPVNSPNPNARRNIPLPIRHFGNVSHETEVLGQVKVLFAQHANTFSELARRYDLAYQEMRCANPTVYLCYAKNDESHAGRLSIELKSRGTSC
jgi:hypothetical protein